MPACPGPDGGRLFADPRGRRRWCSKALRGNHAKVRWTRFAPVQLLNARNRRGHFWSCRASARHGNRAAYAEAPAGRKHHHAVLPTPPTLTCTRRLTTASATVAQLHGSGSCARAAEGERSELALLPGSPDTTTRRCTSNGRSDTLFKFERNLLTCLCRGMLRAAVPLARFPLHLPLNGVCHVPYHKPAGCPGAPGPRPGRGPGPLRPDRDLAARHRRAP
ncbi:CGNR zinc finger domain-containing protein [Streptomyces sp. NPDC047082]|uniref:CGNR zinc finger domain-containing protein n=1 Tax=Streptomyces sp. NPDC047082 TaxID=3155259 RepID=UPI0033FCBFFB